MLKKTITKVLKELIIPELDKIKADVSETKTVLGITNKRIDDLSLQMVEVNRRMDRLYEVIVRREEHAALEQKVIALEREVHEIKSKIAR